MDSKYFDVTNFSRTLRWCAMTPPPTCSAPGWQRKLRCDAVSKPEVAEKKENCLFLRPSIRQENTIFFFLGERQTQNSIQYSVFCRRRYFESP